MQIKEMNGLERYQGCQLDKGLDGILRDLVKDDTLVLPKSSLFVNYLQTKKHHSNARILFPSAFYIIVCFLLNEEEKVAKKKTKLKK